MEHALISIKNVPVDEDYCLSPRREMTYSVFRKKSLIMSVLCHALIVAALTFSLNIASSTKKNEPIVRAPVQAKLYHLPRVVRAQDDSVAPNASPDEEVAPHTGSDNDADVDTPIAPVERGGGSGSLAHSQRLDRMLDDAIRLQDKAVNSDVVTRTLEYTPPFLTLPSDIKVDETTYEEKKHHLNYKIEDKVDVSVPAAVDEKIDDPLLRYQEEIAMHIKSHLRGKVEDVVGCEVILKLSGDGKILNANNVTAGGNCNKLVSAAFRARRVPMPEDDRLLTQLLRLRVTIH